MVEYVLSRGDAPDKAVMSGKFDIYIDDFATRMVYLTHYHNRKSSHNATHFNCRINADEIMIYFDKFTIACYPQLDKQTTRIKVMGCYWRSFSQFVSLDAKSYNKIRIVSYEPIWATINDTKKIIYEYYINVIDDIIVVKTSVDENWEVRIIRDKGIIYVDNIVMKFDYVALLSA